MVMLELINGLVLDVFHYLWFQKTNEIMRDHKFQFKIPHSIIYYYGKP